MRSTTQEKAPPTRKPPQNQPPPPPPPLTAIATAETTVPRSPTKSQQLKPTKNPPPVHRDNHHHRRPCCTSIICFLAIGFFLYMLIFLTAAVLCAVYRPRPPSFSLTSFKIIHLNLTSPCAFTSKINLTITITNPNVKTLTFHYKPINLSVLTYPESIVIGYGSFPEFVHYGKNTTSLFAVMNNNNNNSIDGASFEILKSDLIGKDGWSELKVEMETEIEGNIGNIIKSKWMGLKTSCYGIKALASDFEVVFRGKVCSNCNLSQIMNSFYVSLRTSPSLQQMDHKLLKNPTPTPKHVSSAYIEYDGNWVVPETPQESPRSRPRRVCTTSARKKLRFTEGNEEEEITILKPPLKVELTPTTSVGSDWSPGFDWSQPPTPPMSDISPGTYDYLSMKLIKYHTP